VGATIKTWPINPITFETCPLDGLLPLLGPHTRIVAFPHVSNLLGEVVDVKEVTAAVRRAAPRAVGV